MMRRSITICIALVGLVALAAWWNGRGDGRTHVIVPSVPGDAVLIRTADGRTVLLDGGADGAATVSWLGRELPFWQRRLDAMVLTRADDQTLPGQIAVLRRYSVGIVGYVPPPKTTAMFDAWRELVGANGGTLRVLTPGLRFAIGTAELQVLSSTAGRALLQVRIGQTAVTALESLTEREQDVAESVLVSRADLVLFPWRIRPSDVLAERLQPRTVIYTSGGQTAVGQTFGERWNGTVPLFHPAVHGRIDWSTDGRTGRVVVEQQP